MLLVSTILLASGHEHEHDDHLGKIHKCEHDEHVRKEELRQMFMNYDNHPYQKSIEIPHRNEEIINIQEDKRRLLTESETSPIRISAYYDDSVTGTLTSNDIDFIKQVMSATIRYYESFMRVIPVSGNWYNQRPCNSLDIVNGYQNCKNYTANPTCGQVTIPDDHFGDGYLYDVPRGNYTATYISAGPGVEDADLVLYVSYGSSGCGASTLAYAGPCTYDQYGRPVAGHVNICPLMLASEYWKKDVATMVHEVGHVLIMSSGLWDQFRNSTGSIIPKSDVVTTNANDGKDYIISPKVKEVAQDHFGCSSLIGAPLEDGSSHWDEKYLHSETMTPTIWSAQQYFSEFTMALMEDSGWYYVDYDIAEPFVWGRDVGCDFYDVDCVNSTSQTANHEPFFCHSSSDDGCNADYSSPGYCGFFTGLTIPAQFQYYSDVTAGGYAAADYCSFRSPYTYNDYESTCWDTRGPKSGTYDDYIPSAVLPSVSYGIKSRCLDTLTGSTQRGYCVEQECKGYDSNTGEYSAVDIKLNAETITCTRSDALTMKSSSTISGYQITCPDIDILCGSQSQTSSCYFGHYSDAAQGCVCSAGYTGSDCNTQDTSTSGTEVVVASPSSVTTPSPTSPTSKLCVKNFPFFSGEYDYVDMWNGQPSYYQEFFSGAYKIYVYWNIYTHQWQLFTTRNSGSFGYFQCLVPDDGFVDISEIRNCDGIWTGNGAGSSAIVYTGPCNSAAPTQAPTKSPTQP